MISSPCMWGQSFQESLQHQDRGGKFERPHSFNSMVEVSANWVKVTIVPGNEPLAAYYPLQPLNNVSRACRSLKEDHVMG